MQSASKAEKEKIGVPSTPRVDIDDDLDKDDDKDTDARFEPSETSCIATCVGLLCFPFTLMCSWYVVSEREEVVQLNCGKYQGVTSDPGCHWANCVGRDLRRIDKRVLSLELPNSKVVDKNGNPLIVSGIVCWHVANAKRAAIDVQNVNLYVQNEAQAVLKKIVSMYPYEAHDEEGKEHHLSLKVEASEIQKQMAKMLHRQVKPSGARILSFQFNELSYAPEIAAGMLRRQQAKATVAARRKIVQGAVDIAYGAADELIDRGISMSIEERNKMVSNLLLVITGDSDANQGGLAAASLEGQHFRPSAPSVFPGAMYGLSPNPVS